MNALESYQPLLQERLTPRRYHHTLCVAKRAKELALAYGADPQKAELTGLLHDICKDLTPEKMLQTIEGFGILLTDLERRCPKTWHAIAGKAYLREELGITDSEVLDAVRYHTTGRQDMSLLEQAVYLADFTSEDRTFDGVEEVRKAADEDRVTGMVKALAFTIQEVTGRGSPIHTDTIACYNQFAILWSDSKQPTE